MRSAPPVSVSASSDGLWRVLQAALPALAAACFAAWAVGHAGTAAPVHVAAALISSAVVGWLAWRLSASGPVTLVWDGQVWALNGTAHQLELMIDLDRWMLLRLQLADGAAVRWLALGAGEAGPAWHGLRAAVYSRASKTTSRVLLTERTAD